MTLSNIFFGKKVVKQAYLNNALIYQSKGWETLPSTCTETWTKSYDKADAVCSVAKDDSDNLYVSSNNSVYKIDSEGNLKWEYVISDATTTTSIVVFPTYIYCAYSASYNFGYVAKIDTNGNLISTAGVHDLTPDSSYYFFDDMQKDSNNIYAITHSHLLKLNQDLKVIDDVDISSAAHGCNAECIAINNGPYIFVGTSNYGFRLDKSNFKNSISLPEYSFLFSTDSIAMDNIGNLYLGSSTQKGPIKYDAENCQAIKILSLNYNYALCLDNQENVYFVMHSDTYRLAKYSSDGTEIWETNIPASSDHIKIVTDSNNNICVAYVDNNSKLAIKKFINLVKEN
ncbi:hypothetical protein [uncultured Lactobacillus sp.]|uniref:hypothetical protein n=1 Tax=uncultured Lactobacillus sp. TaxID=153152 RepID=UPI0025D4FE48|nr:hypothetical protein [uncultured Lactobacillus sp.]